MIKNIIAISTGLVFLLSSCTYLKYSAIQMKYTNIQKAEPSQVNLKHMIDQNTFFIWGKLTADSELYSNVSMAIVAYSSKFKKNEQVDSMFFKGIETHYGLNVPEGEYTLLVYADVNNDQVFQQSEVVGNRNIVVNTVNFPQKIVKNIDIHLMEDLDVVWAEPISMPTIIKTKRPIHYPAGTIRRLDDPMFDENIATMGMYDPASFFEYAKTMFYTLEEGVAHKIPVVFVHGIGGSTRSFKTIIEQMDNNRYQAWFFYYPSGGDLDQLAGFFYNIFLSGDAIPMGDMPLIVVAHSMGGLIVREALNEYEGKLKENKMELFVSIASPFGGHPSAASGEKNGLIVLPAWKDLNPTSQFITELYRKPLPASVNHQLLYAFNNSSAIKLGENTDGVVPLSSQLHPRAQKQSDEQFGFNNNHVDILEDETMVKHLLEAMSQVENIFPESHMKLLIKGGFDIKLPDSYSPVTKHLVNYAGKYLILLVNDHLKPINSQQKQFIQAVKGDIVTTKRVEKEFIQFMKQYPEIIDRFLQNKHN